MDPDSILAQLISYIRYNNFEVKDSCLHSVFDLLYQQYTAERLAYEATHPKTHEYLSEQLIYDLITKAIEKKGKLTQEVIDQINACTKLIEIENIYKPYVEKKKTRAANAINLGLEPLSKYLLSLPKGSIKEEVNKYVKDKITYDDAINGAKDIIAEIVAYDNDIRKEVKKSMLEFGFIKTKIKSEENDQEKIYRLYYDAKLKANKVQGYKIMAIGRAEKEKVITFKFEFDKNFSLKQAIWKYTKNYKSEAADLIIEAINDGFTRLLIPSVENEIWSELYESAQEESIKIFARNLEAILSQRPLKNKMVLGVDPAFRTGCKLALINKNNSLVLTDTIYQNEPHNKKEQAEKIVLKILNQYPVDIIAIGNGTASRETENFFNEVLTKNKINIPHVIVSEVGASVYSASENARKEFGDLEVQKRSAISIARRIVDPLAELIKIDPKSIGVGQYQHDLPEDKLDENLDFTVKKIVNRIGVDINTASEELLKNISGLNATIAKTIIQYRNEHDKFMSRKEIEKLPKITKKVFEQSSGFLRIIDGDNILDSTSIHPDDYNTANYIIDKYKIDLLKNNENLTISKTDIQDIVKQTNSSEITIESIIQSIKEQRRDYREQFDAPLLRNDVLSFEDLKQGMQLSGVVRNIVDFGAFIDIGIKNDSLLHTSNITKDKFVNPFETFYIGQIVNVYVKNINKELKKVELALYE